MFKRIRDMVKKESTPSEVDPAQLAAIAVPLFEFCITATCLPSDLVLKPNSPKGALFVKALDDLAIDLQTKGLTPSGLVWLQERLHSMVERFAGEQRIEVEGLIAELSLAVARLVKSMEAVLVDQKDVTSGLGSLTEHLAAVRDCNDLTTIRTALTEELVHAHRLVEKQRRLEDCMRQEFESVIRGLESKLKDAEKEKMTDALTGLPNRTALEVYLRRVALRTSIGRSTYSFGMIDLDGFKFINDTYGHAAGDVALHHFAGLLKKTFEGDGFAARFGGDEFAVVLLGSCVELEKRICKLSKQLHLKGVFVPGGGREPIRAELGCSAGVATLSTLTPFEETIMKADKALLEAKRLGKNRVQMVQDRLAA